MNHSHYPPHSPYQYKQQGVALLIFVMVMLLAGTSLLFSVLNSNRVNIERDKKTAEALAEAKAALIGWSVNRSNPGQLPCPEDISLIDSPTEGQAQNACTSLQPVIGRLPWRTLGVGDLRDGYGERLWYVISPGFRTSPINSTTPAQLSVDGVAGSAVAVVFSAGSVLAGQSRPTPTVATPPDVTQYLDLSNNDNNFSFITRGVASTFNDKLLAITGTELFSTITLRVLNEVRGNDTHGMKEYYLTYSEYPFADIDNDGKSDLDEYLGKPSFQGHTYDSLFFSPTIKNMLSNNGWFPLFNYQVSADQQSAILTLNGKALNLP
jgi:hypothetical protein